MAKVKVNRDDVVGKSRNLQREKPSTSAQVIICEETTSSSSILLKFSWQGETWVVNAIVALLLLLRMEETTRQQDDEMMRREGARRGTLWLSVVSAILA